MKGVIFDWDETLINSFDVAFFELNLVAEKLNLRRPGAEEFAKHWGKPLHMFILKIWPDANIDHVAEVLQEISSTVHAPDFKENAKEVIDMLLDMNVRLALVSSRDRDQFPWQDPIMKKFDVIVTEQDTRFHKPDPAVFEKVFQRWKDIRKKDMYYVGDVLTDFEAAKNARINFICLLNEKLHKRETFLEAGIPKQMITTDLKDIVKIIS